jgi:hypothetical protein
MIGSAGPGFVVDPDPLEDDRVSALGPLADDDGGHRGDRGGVRGSVERARVELGEVDVRELAAAEVVV